MVGINKCSSHAYSDMRGGIRSNVISMMRVRTDISEERRNKATILHCISFTAAADDRNGGMDLFFVNVLDWGFSILVSKRI